MSSVTAVSVTPSLPVATATSTYAVNFTASDATSAGGDIYLTEPEGPTNFSTVAGIAVTDNTQHWEFIATGAALANGSATIPLQDAIDAGDSLTVTLTDVTNPGAIGTINDFAVSTSGDPVAVSAPPYSIGANGTPGVLVTVNPNSLGASATYTLSNILAAADLAGGSATIKLEAPAGTVFPNSPSDYGITDDTTPSGSGTVTAALSGGGTNEVTFTLPNNIKQGDELTLNVADVLNPTIPSSTDSITPGGRRYQPAANRGEDYADDPKLFPCGLAGGHWRRLSRRDWDHLSLDLRGELPSRDDGHAGRDPRGGVNVPWLERRLHRNRSVSADDELESGGQRDLRFEAVVHSHPYGLDRFRRGE